MRKGSSPMRDGINIWDNVDQFGSGVQSPVQSIWAKEGFDVEWGQIHVVVNR